jgi:DNA/RNA endonuclease YhcR with UshA esterase domain
MKGKDRPSSECPSCGRFVGPSERCPYCGADVGQRIAVRAFKYGSLVLAVLGLAMLLFVARRSQVPTVDVGSLAGTMNWAYVRIEGVTSRQPAYDPEAQSLGFWVWDGTGEILVTAYRSEIEALVAGNRVPQMGDEVAVEGTLRIKDDFQYLVLNVPEHTEIRAAEAVEMPIAEVGGAARYQKVRVKGMVRADRIPYEGLRILTVRDGSGEIDVTLPVGAEPWDDAWPNVAVGQVVEAAGTVDLYKDSPQVSVGRGHDLLVLDETMAIAPERRIGELSAGDVGSLYAVQGVISQVSTFSAGTRLMLDDGSGTATVLLWQDVYDSLGERDALVQGATVHAVGEVSEYRGELEIVPELGADVAVVVTAERIVVEQPVGELGLDDVGQTVSIEGVLQSLRTFSAGVRGNLDDGTGTVTLVLWQEVYDGLASPASVAPGAVLRVEGEVSEYKGKLEVVPQAAADVTLIGTVELPTEELAIGQLTVDDAGQTAQVTGRIAQVVPFSKGVKYTLDDGTGTITLLLWQDLYDRLDNVASLAEEAQISVRGQIDEYQGELEIVPQVPADILAILPQEVAQVTSTPIPGHVEGIPPEPTAEPTDGPAPTPTSTPPATPTSTVPPTPTAPPTPSVETRKIGSLTTADVGKTFTVAKAGIASVDYFSKGVRYTITDASGSIILLVWQDVMEKIPDRYDLFPGSQVQVTGEIDEYGGELEIIPQDGMGLTVLHRGERPPIEKRTADHVTASDEGRVFTMEGRVTRIDGRGWLRAWIQDGTGEMLVFVPERAVEYLPAGIGPGVRLRVTGEVDIYQGEIEIIPLAAADVEVRGP